MSDKRGGRVLAVLLEWSDAAAVFERVNAADLKRGVTVLLRPDGATIIVPVTGT